MPLPWFGWMRRSGGNGVARTIIDPMPGDPERIYSVTELAREFATTARAIRFYEGKGLISPARVGANRAYTHRDRARLVLILRGKRLGFSLREIKDFLALYHSDPEGLVQMRALAGRLRERMSDLEHQREVLDATLADLKRLLLTVERSIERGRGTGAAAPVEASGRHRRAAG